ncbi:uncharacterized protein PHALS_09037 [Plasmopara halstedii]|uniref:Uncharacterized protein n=1 Tax=Plasmopara halstedii TaxID=4781 RepID=A0A0P1A4Q4_PLAHL|nr:uncharacterized protein PHALS_09037 [Plasmopara halstedii]CEG35225.1 hypothetical protein PHALS_09037 [Plasmopara halstedii]|eukprot:XP_024571594.1 hypothetical protein PHALS_09037 [Plasmopara halstedii]
MKHLNSFCPGISYRLGDEVLVLILRRTGITVTGYEMLLGHMGRNFHTCVI